MQWQSIVPVTIESLSYYHDKLYVRNPNWIVELDPKNGKRLHIGAASWGWGGLAFLKDQMFVSGIQSQYGTSGATGTNLDEPNNPIKSKIPTLEDIHMFKPKALKGAPDLAAMGTPLSLGDKLCFASTAGKVFIVEADGTKRWSFQLGGTCHATPVAADGKIYFLNEDGETIVVKAGVDRFEQLARNPLGEATQSTPGTAARIDSRIGSSAKLKITSTTIPKNSIMLSESLVRSSMSRSLRKTVKILANIVLLSR
jgi:outer membrane protein assembly factor BamB